MQNLISLKLTQQDVTDAETAIATLQRVFAAMLVLSAEQRRDLFKMGDKSEAFCRQTLTILAANPGVIPPNLDLVEAQADLAALDALRPLIVRMQQLTERAEDTAMALGADLMAAALEGYALLKVSGRGEALREARAGLSARFAKGPRAAKVAPADA